MSEKTPTLVVEEVQRFRCSFKKCLLGYKNGKKRAVAFDKKFEEGIGR